MHITTNDSGLGTQRTGWGTHRRQRVLFGQHKRRRQDRKHGVHLLAKHLVPGKVFLQQVFAGEFFGVLEVVYPLPHQQMGPLYREKGSGGSGRGGGGVKQ